MFRALSGPTASSPGKQRNRFPASPDIGHNLFQGPQQHAIGYVEEVQLRRQYCSV